MQNPNTAEALNYRGYATRKLGRTDEGISYYLKSVSMDPKYSLVREYLGEAYVIKGQIDLAKDQIEHDQDALRQHRLLREYQDLNNAIQNPSSL